MAVTQILNIPSHFKHIFSSLKNHQKMSQRKHKLLKETVQQILKSNEEMLHTIQLNNDLITAIREDICPHDWNWMNDPYNMSLHECDICGVHKNLDTIKSKVK
jgi:hypothetical protein